MAMAMASTVVSLAGARILKAPAVYRSSVAARSSGSVSRLCSSFTGLSLQSWQKSRHTGDISGLSISAAPSVVSPARSVVLTVAKIKTHKASAKRFKVTGSGKIMRRQAFKQHLLRKKNSKRKRRLSKMTQVNRSDYDNVIGALPYLNVKGREQ